MQFSAAKRLLSARITKPEASVKQPNILNTSAHMPGYRGANQAVGPVEPANGDENPCPVAKE
jgi:hypothetical protein